jgi:hypothetical protein
VEVYLAYVAGALVILGVMLMAVNKWKIGTLAFIGGVLAGLFDLLYWLG